MNHLLDLAKGNDAGLERAFAEAAALPSNPARRGEMLETLAYLAAQQRNDEAELLAWSWLSAARSTLTPAEALDLGRQILLRLPASAQVRGDVLELYKAAFPDRPEVPDWLIAAGLTGTKVSPQRAFRAADLALALSPGRLLLERAVSSGGDLHEHRVIEVIRIDPKAGTAAIRPLGGVEREAEILRLADDHELADPDDFRVLARRDPTRLKERLNDDPLAMLISMIRGLGGQIDADQLKDNLVERVLTDGEYARWWSRARTAARKSPNVRIEGRNPTMLIYDAVGTSIEAETAQKLAKTWDPPARLAVVEGYLKHKAEDGVAAPADFLNDLAARVAKWLAANDAGLAEALVAHRLAAGGVPIEPALANRAGEILAAALNPTDLVVALPDADFWSMALDLLPAARPAGAGPGEDWQAVYLRLLPHAPQMSADRMTAALLEAGQTDRLNAVIEAIVEAPRESLDGLCWLWHGPAQADRLQMPRPAEVLDPLLALAKAADEIVKTDAKFAREIRAKVRGALSARSFAQFRAYVSTLPADLAPMLRRLVRRADGLGVTIPEQLLAILDEKHAPPIDARTTAALWQQENVMYVSPAALAAKESELEHITNVLMPANSRAIAAAAAHGDLSENAEFKAAQEERDLLKARVARIQGEMSQARVVTAQEVPTDHVSIYSIVELAPSATPGPEAPAAGLTVQIVSPWDGDVAARRFNYRAPISKQLLGKHVGDPVRLNFEGGPDAVPLEFRITALRQPAR